MKFSAFGMLLLACRRANRPASAPRLLAREPVPDAGFRQQMARSRRIVFQLVAQLPHVDTQVVRLLRIRRPLDFAQQLALRDDLSEITYEHG